MLVFDCNCFCFLALLFLPLTPKQKRVVEGSSTGDDALAGQTTPAGVDPYPDVVGAVTIAFVGACSRQPMPSTSEPTTVIVAPVVTKHCK